MKLAFIFSFSLVEIHCPRIPTMHLRQLAARPNSPRYQLAEKLFFKTYFITFYGTFNSTVDHLNTNQFVVLVLVFYGQVVQDNNYYLRLFKKKFLLN